jgi:hypothetical protein
MNRVRFSLICTFTFKKNYSGDDDDDSEEDDDDDDDDNNNNNNNNKGSRGMGEVVPW